MVNYLPKRISLTAETAPPPINPKLQYCIEEMLFEYYDNQSGQLRSYVDTLRAADISFLPEKSQKALNQSLDRTLNTFDLVAEVRMAEENLGGYSSEYRPQHRQVRSLQSKMRNIRLKIDNLKQDLTRASRSESPDKDELIRIEAEIEKAETAINRPSKPDS